MIEAGWRLMSPTGDSLYTPQVPPNPIVTASPSTMTGTCRFPFV
jgi:hypothetical protein